MVKIKKWQNKVVCSCRQIFCSLNEWYWRCNKYTDKRNKTALVIFIFIVVLVIPYLSEAYPTEVGSNFNYTERSTERYLNFFTVTTKNISEEEIISTTTTFGLGDIASIPNNGVQHQNLEISVEVNDDISVNNESSTEVDNVSQFINTIVRLPVSGENLEQSIRNSVKSEIENERRLESSQVLEILKELTEPEIRETLSADIISLDNFDLNKINLPSPVEQNMFPEKDKISSEVKENIEHVKETVNGKRMTNFENKYEASKTILITGKKLAIGEKNLHENNDYSNSNKYKVVKKSKFDMGVEFPLYENETLIDIISSSRQLNSSETLEKLLNNKAKNERILDSNGTISNLSEFTESINAFKVETDPKTKEETALNKQNNVKENLRQIEEADGNKNYNNEMVSVTLDEAISDTSMNTYEGSILGVEKHNITTEQIMRENKNNTIGAEQFEHVIIKEVLDLNKNTDISLETTTRIYYKNITFSEKISPTHIKSAELSKNDTFNKFEVLSNEIEANHVQSTNSDYISRNTKLNYIKNTERELDNIERIKKLFEKIEENYDENGVVKPSVNSNINEFFENNQIKNQVNALKDTVNDTTTKYTDKYLQHEFDLISENIPLIKTAEIDKQSVELKHCSNNTKSNFRNKLIQEDTHNEDTKYNEISEKFNTNRDVVKYNQSSEKLHNEYVIGKNLKNGIKNPMNTIETDISLSEYNKSNANNAEQYLKMTVQHQSKSNSGIEDTKLYNLRMVLTDELISNRSGPSPDIEDTNQYNLRMESTNELTDFFPTTQFPHVQEPIENTTLEITLSGDNDGEENAKKHSHSVNTKDFALKYNDKVATVLECYPPRGVGQTCNDNLPDESTGIGKALPISIANGSNKSTIIIILSSSTALIFIIILVTIFLISFQRQNGTLDIEMQERSCGKDNLEEEDAQTFAMLLDVEASVAIALDETDECL